MSNLERWKSAQIAAAIERGTNPIDAQMSLKWFLEHLPPGANPESYIMPSYALEQTLASEVALSDARAAWYGSSDVPVVFKRLLDAALAD